AASKASEELFRECQDFAEQAREYELEKRMHQDHIVQRQSTMQSLQLAEEEISDEIPDLYWLTALCGGFLLALAVAYYLTSTPAVIYGGMVGVMAVLYFIYRIGNAKVRLKKSQQQIAETRSELDRLEKLTGEPGLIE